jgi:hypothetical protein
MFPGLAGEVSCRSNAWPCHPCRPEVVGLRRRGLAACFLVGQTLIASAMIATARMPVLGWSTRKRAVGALHKVAETPADPTK